VKKCRWFNDAAAAATLMIDDLTNGYLDLGQAGLTPANDWGFGCRGPQSIFGYFERILLGKYPEIRYTVFLPFGRHSIGLVDGGYTSVAHGAFESKEFVALMRHILNEKQEIAYHGHHHGSPTPSLSPETWVGEHRYVGNDLYRKTLQEDRRRLFEVLGAELSGGKSPGYDSEPDLAKVIGDSGFRWWVFDFAPHRRTCRYRERLLDFPANLAGDLFSPSPRPLKARITRFRAEYRVQKLIERGGILAIQEHFLSTRPDGRRQTPNVHDDINSLDYLFSLLRGNDIWFATCGEIARYCDSRDHTEIVVQEPGIYRLVYNGTWSAPQLSVACETRLLQNTATGQVIRGSRKRGRWVFNGLTVATYREM